MTFTVGETVVYPNHGAAVIEDIETRKIKGEDKQYLVLRIVAQQDLVVRVPACNLDLVGVSAKVQANLLETPHSAFLRIQAFNGTQKESGVGELEYTESYVTIGYQATFDFKTW